MKNEPNALGVFGCLIIATILLLLFYSYTPTSQGAAKADAVLSIEDLLDAIEQIESGCDCNAVSCKGAVGAYQILKIYVDDVNRILGQKKYSYEDRWNREKSREMTKIYITHYGGDNFEKMARIHYGGPQGYKKKSTKQYWLKVKTEMEKSSGQ